MIRASTAREYRKLDKHGKLTPGQKRSLREFEAYHARGTETPPDELAGHSLGGIQPQPQKVRAEEPTPPQLSQFAGAGLPADSKGGKCPSCGNEVRDNAQACSRCGARVRLDKCAHCAAPLEAGAAFCSQCQKPVEVPKAISPAAPAVKGEIVTPQAPPPVPLWTVNKVLWFGGLLNILLKKKGLEPLDDDEKKELHEALVPVMNKYLLPVGPYADEIRLAIVAGTMIGARMYVLYVILPEREERKKQKEAEEKKKSASASEKKPA